MGAALILAILGVGALALSKLELIGCRRHSPGDQTT